MNSAVTALVGDLGGTNARFGIVNTASNDHTVAQLRVLRCSDYANVEAAIDDYFSQIEVSRPELAVLAAAGPVTNGVVRFTNNHWHCSLAALQAQGFRRARLLNDFEALAYAAAQLSGSDLQSLGGPAAGMPGNIAVLGPGTGFGLSMLARDGNTAVAIATEGGNAAFAPNDALEVDVLRVLAARLGRVVIESILSGHGLFNLYDALCTVHGQPATATNAPEVTALAQRDDAMAALATQRFCAILGSVAGDVALSTGSRGGIYITGGMTDVLAEELLHGQFRTRFDAKGRYGEYVSAIPTAHIRRPQPALLGAAVVAHALARL